MINLATNNIIITRDVIWLEKFIVENKNEKQSEKHDNIDENITYGIDDEDDDEKDDEELEENNPEPPKIIPREVRNLRTFFNPRPEEFVETAFIGAIDSGYMEPKTFKQAWEHTDLEERKKWRDAINKEFHDMISKKVWRCQKLQNVAEERKLVGSNGF